MKRVISSASLAAAIACRQCSSSSSGVGGSGSYGSGENPSHDFLKRGRRDVSFTSNEKKRMAQFWENIMLRTLQTPEQLEKSRHYTKLEEEERLAEQKRDEARCKERIANQEHRLGHGMHAFETPIPRRNLKPDIASEYAQHAPNTPEAEEDAMRHLVVEKLVKAERRIKFAPDYGSNRVMAMLGDAKVMMDEAEDILMARKWMGPEVKERLDQMRREMDQVKFDFDID